MSLRSFFHLKAKADAAETAAAIARQGNVFQTRTFRNPAMPLLGNFYLKAQNRPDQQWTVYRVSERPASPAVAAPASDEEIVVQHEKLKAGLTFVEALRYLANFENTAADVGHQSAAEDEKNALGFRHFEAFAHREGVAFDCDGTIHKTDAGEVVTEGTFTKKEMKLLQERYQPASKQIEAGVDDCSLLLDLMQHIPLADDIKILRNQKILFNNVWQPLKKAHEQWPQWRASKSGGYHHTADAAWEDVRAGLREAETSIERLTFMDTGNLKKGIKVFRLFFAIQAAQVSFAGDARNFERDEKIVKTYLAELELPENFADAVMIQDPELKSKKLPNPVDDFVRYCCQINEEFGEALTRSQQGQKAAFAPEQLPAPIVRAKLLGTGGPG